MMSNKGRTSATYGFWLWAGVFWECLVLCNTNSVVVAFELFIYIYAPFD